MALNKNTGPPLTSTGRGSVDNFPREFLAKIGIRTVSQQVPVDIEPKDLTLLLVESKLTQERTDERKLADTYLLEPPNENPLLSEVKLESGLVGARTRQLVPDPTDLDPLVGCLTETADQVNLGNGWLDQTVVQAPSLFTRAAFRRTRPDVTPPDFGALLETDEVSVTACGTASDPALGDQDLSATDEQLDVWKHRTTRATLDNLELPQTIVNKSTSQVKQVETVTRILEDASTTPAVPTAVRDVTFTKLGDGTALEIRTDVDSVFPHQIYGRERSIVTPEDFRALLQTTSFVGTQVGNATPPSALADGVVSITDEDTDVFTHRETVRLIDVLTLPQTITNKRTNRYKQVETVARVLEAASATPQTPTALKDVTFTKLGDGTALEERVTIPSVFDRIAAESRRGDNTPQDFTGLFALRLHETASTQGGTVTDPPALPGGLISRREEQEDLFTFRRVDTSRDFSGLPTQLQNKRTNRFKQVETVTRILEDATTVPAVPTALRDVTFTKLGDGTALEEQVTIESVFVNRTSSKELPDLIPDIFKALLPVIGSETTFAGQIDVPPVLDTGEFFRSETQIDEFTKKITTRKHSVVSLPQDVTILRHLGGFEFGGERTKLTGYLDDSAPSVEEGLGIVSSEVKDLGNGMFFRQTEKWDTASEWPELTGTEVDPRTGIIVTVLRKTVAAGTTGGVSGDDYIDVKSIDKWRSIQITSRLDAGSLPAPRTWETTIEHAFPNTLNSAFWLWAEAVAPHAFDFDTTLLLDITQGYAGPCRALVTESFSQGPPLDAVSITQFFPQAYTVGYAWAYADDVTADEDCGDCFGIARANSRTWPIPPTLHNEITIGGGVVVTGGGISNTIPATNPTGLPGSGTLITKAVDVDVWRFNIFYRRMVQIYVP